MTDDKPQQATPTELLKLIKEHLEYFGYTVTERGSNLAATNPANVSFSVHPYQDGALFLAPYEVKPGVTAATEGLLDFVNKGNIAAIAGRFVWNEKYSSLYAEAWYPSVYDRKHFGIFLNHWLLEVRRYFNTPAAQRFIQ